MLGAVQAGSQQAYQHYLATWRETIGRQIWSGVCATCHGNLGQGGYGPPIANSTLLTQESALAGIVHNGFDTPARPGAMPPVADTWTKEELDALAAYVKKNIYKTTPPGASSGR